MTGEYAQDQQHLEAALAHAVRGDREAAGAELAHIYMQSADRMFRLWQALAGTALLHPAGPAALKTFAPYQAVDLDDNPPAVSLALRVLAAQAANDVDALDALFKAPLHAGDTEVLADVLPILLDAAAESVRAQSVRSGTFGSGTGT